MNWVLIAVVGVLVFCAFYGRARGLVKTVFSLFSTIVVIVVTVWFSPQVSKWMQGNEKIFGYLSEQVGTFVRIGDVGSKVSEQIEYINELPLPKELKKVLQDNNNAETYVQLAAENFEDYVVKYVTCIILNAAAFVFTFLILRLILAIAAGALDVISKLPVINGVNKLAGMAVGLAYGVVIVWIAFVVITMFGGKEFGQTVMGMIGENKFLSFLYSNNLILRFLTDTGKMIVF